MTKQTKRNNPQQDGETMSKEDLSKRLAAARLDLNTALLTGESTAALRAAVRTIEGEIAAMDAHESAKQAAQRAEKDAEAQRINDAAADLLAAQRNRVAAVTARFAIRPLPATV